MAGQQSDPNQIEDGINEINITPFVDVVLVLLVIFMVTAPVMMKEQLKVQLPKSLTADLENKSSTVGVAITKEGQFLFNGRLIADQELENELKSIAVIDIKTHFLISADAESRHSDLVRFIDHLKRQGLSAFALQVERIQPATSP